MRTISAERIDELLPGLLDEVIRGESVTITRHGIAVARIAPVRDQARADQAVEEIRRLREEVRQRLAAEGKPLITVDEILSWRDEGRRWQ